MSTRSTSSNLFSPLRDPESLIRRRNLGEPSSLFDFEEVMSIPHNNMGPPPAGAPPPPNNGPPSVVRPNSHRDTINATAGGTFMQKTPEECYELIENMTAHHNHWDTLGTRDETSRNISSTTTTESPEVVRQLEMMNKNFVEMMRQIQMIKSVDTKCETYGGLHSFTECPAADGYTQEATYATMGDVKAITTRSGVAYDGLTFPPTHSPLSKEVEHETEVTKDKVQNTSLGSTAHVQPPVIQDPILEPKVAPKSKPKLSIPYPSRLNDQKLREKANNQMLKFLQIFQRLHFDISFADALLYMPKFASTFKSLLTLIDVHGEEMTLRVNDEAIMFKVGHTLRYSSNYYDETVNQVNVIDVACEEYAQEVLGFSDSSISGNPTPSDPIIASSSPSFTPFKGGDFVLEEIEACLLNNLIPSGIDDANFDLEGDISLLEKLLNDDPSSRLPPKELNFEELQTIKSSITDPPELELKDLPSHLNYTFLEGTDK
ncbi:hypothetical protein Tco_0459409 [Tanacetum coccineum]